jgi:hypothetical protein
LSNVQVKTPCTRPSGMVASSALLVCAARAMNAGPGTPVPTSSRNPTPVGGMLRWSFMQQSIHSTASRKRCARRNQRSQAWTHTWLGRRSVASAVNSAPSSRAGANP